MKEENAARARSALAGKWLPLGKYAYVCGEWTACNFVVSGEEKWMLYRGGETVGQFDDREAAMLAARERKAA